MWTKVNISPGNNDIIYFPQQFKENLYNKKIFDEQEIRIAFGAKEISATIKSSDHCNVVENSSFDKPMIIEISKSLKDKLLIPDSLCYQMKFNKNKIMLGPVIGFLLGNKTYLYTPKHMEKYSDRFGIYNKIGGLVCAFSPRAINWQTETVYGLYYNIKNSKWEYGKFPIPKVIYRRNFKTDTKTLEKLINKSNNKLFNSYRFTKEELYNYICNNEELGKHVPPTEKSKNYNQLKKFLDKHNKIILKPTHLSRGRGICVITKTSSKYIIADYRKKKTDEVYHFDEKKLQSFFLKNDSFFTKYIIQSYLDLAQIEGCVCDFRIAMQKFKQKDWKCTGIECRIANKGSHVTNITRGGYALPYLQAVRKAFPDVSDYQQIKKQITNFCQKLCLHLDKTDAHYGELGIDIALDQNKKVWFIEANVLPSFKGIKKVDYSSYLNIRYLPLLYAVTQTKFDIDDTLYKPEDKQDNLIYKLNFYNDNN